MAGMNADFINPFLMSATKIMQEICQTEMEKKLTENRLTEPRRKKASP